MICFRSAATVYTRERTLLRLAMGLVGASVLQPLAVLSDLAFAVSALHVYHVPPSFKVINSPPSSLTRGDCPTWITGTLGTVELRAIRAICVRHGRADRPGSALMTPATPLPGRADPRRDGGRRSPDRPDRKGLTSARHTRTRTRRRPRPRGRGRGRASASPAPSRARATRRPRRRLLLTPAPTRRRPTRSPFPPITPLPRTVSHIMRRCP